MEASEGPLSRHCSHLASALWFHFSANAGTILPMSLKPTPLMGLIWFHRDLRTSDHAGLELIETLGGSWLGIVLSLRSSHRAARQFETECQDELEANLKSKSIPLHRLSESQVQSFIRDAYASNQDLLMLTSRRYNFRDQGLLDSALSGFPETQLRIFDHSTLYAESDLPFSLAELPKTFTPFQKKIRGAKTSVRAAPSILSQPEMEPVLTLDPGLQFKGGETNAHARVHQYLTATRAALHYHETRNGLLARDDSSKLSPYLAQGCISPGQVFWEIKKIEDELGPSKGLDALIYELEWRDYFKFLSLRSGRSFFEPKGLKSQEPEASPDRERFESWCRGETGNAFVDANLRELLTTGWMSNRGRQNVASFLAKTMKLPWLWGAEWFEKNLIDFDVETNQGNWMYLSGVGTDPRDRVFNPDLQATMYDPDGAYRARWLS